MVQGVQLGALSAGGYGLRVSRPGYDVSNGLLRGKAMAFDSGWSNSTRVVLSGSVFVPQNSTPLTYTTAYFGQSFPEIPPVIIYVEEGGKWKPAIQHFLDGWMEDFTSLYPVRVYPDRIVFYRNYFGSYTGHYIILGE